MKSSRREISLQSAAHKIIIIVSVISSSWWQEQLHISAGENKERGNKGGPFLVGNISLEILAEYRACVAKQPT